MYAYGFRGFGASRSTSRSLGIETHIPEPAVCHRRGRLVPAAPCSRMAMREYVRRQARLHRADRRRHLVLCSSCWASGSRRRASRRCCRSSTGAPSSSTSRFSRWSAASRRRHVLDVLAQALKPLFTENYALGATLLYWVTVPIVGIVEHDAYILTFLYTIKDLRHDGVEPWPLWWMLLWSGHARQQPHGGRRAGALCRAEHRREGRRSQRLAARVPVLERALHARLLAACATSSAC